MRTELRTLSLGLVAVLTLAACGDGDPVAGPTPSTPAATQEPTDPGTSDAPTPEPSDETLLIEIRDGQVVGGVPEIEAAIGETVTFRVLSDAADEVHVHGVDVHVDVEPGVEATVEFSADIPGQFEIELEGAGLRIADLIVR